MSKAELLSAPPCPAGSIRAYLKRPLQPTELVPLNNLLSIVARFGVGEFVVPALFWESCAQDWWERFEEDLILMRRTDGSYRRVLKDCILWVAEEGETDRVLFQPKGSEIVYAFEIGDTHRLDSPV